MLGNLKRIYAERLRVGEYFLFDPFDATFEGFELGAAGAGYVEKAPDEQGRLSCKQMGLQLGVRKSRLWGVEAPWLSTLMACWRNVESEVFIDFSLQSQ